MDLERAIPERFLVINDDVSLSDVVDAIEERFQGVRLAEKLDQTLLPIYEIDSFSTAAKVSPEDVAGIANPLDVPEEEIKRLIVKILAEVGVKKDWGGERDDIFTTRARLGGREIPASFVLKGPGTKGALTPAKLGANGDQIERALTQPIELLVVQYVGVIEPSVRERLRDGVLARRAEGKRMVGSVWDGVDTARLFVATGLLDASTGEVLG